PGGLYLALIVTNPLYLNLSIVFIGLYLWAWWPQKDTRYLLLSSLWAFAGAAFVFILLGLVNYLAGRGFVFTSALFAATKYYLEGGNSIYWKGQWFFLESSKSYVGPIAAMLLVSVAELLRLFRKSKWSSTERAAALLYYFYIFHTMVWIAWQVVGQTALDY